MILICLGMSSSYPIDTPCVEREDEDFSFFRAVPLAASLSTTHYLETKKPKGLQAGSSLYLSTARSILLSAIGKVRDSRGDRI